MTEPIWRCESCGAWEPREPWEVNRFGPRCKWCEKSISASVNRSHNKRPAAPKMWPAMRASPSGDK